MLEELLELARRQARSLSSQSISPNPSIVPPVAKKSLTEMLGPGFEVIVHETGGGGSMVEVVKSATGLSRFFALRHAVTFTQLQQILLNIKTDLLGNEAFDNSALPE